MKISTKLILILTVILISISTGSVLYFYKFKSNKSAKINNNTNISKKADANKSEKTPEALQKVPETKCITISCVGDCTLGTDTNFSYNTFNDVAQSHNNDYSYFLKNVAGIFSSDDITTANLETTFTESNDKNTKTYNFKGHYDYAKILNLGSIEGVNIANNHTYDYNQKGLDDTIQCLKDHNVNYFGYDNIWKTEVKNYKIAFIGYKGFSDDSTFLKNLKSTIADLKSQNYYVIANFHWGIEGTYTPIATQTNIAHTAIDSGADLIIGHHPHVIQGIEKYKGKIICYSLGNFCFGGNNNPPDKNTFIFQQKLNLTDNTLTSTEFRIIPCNLSSQNDTNDYCPIQLDGQAKTNFLNKVNSLSINVGTTISDTFTGVN